mgnify:CR=1 FL=1
MTRRKLRINELLRREISQILSQQINDPRLSGLVSITQTDTSPDLKYAKVLVSVMGNREDKEAAIRGLTSASGFLRKELGLRLALRHVPQLTFVMDDNIEYAQNMLKLMDSLVYEESSSGELNQSRKSDNAD